MNFQDLDTTPSLSDQTSAASRQAGGAAAGMARFFVRDERGMPDGFATFDALGAGAGNLSFTIGAGNGRVAESMSLAMSFELLNETANQRVFRAQSDIKVLEDPCCEFLK